MLEAIGRAVPPLFATALRPQVVTEEKKIIVPATATIIKITLSLSSIPAPWQFQNTNRGT